MKKLLLVWAVGVFLLAMTSVAFAVTVGSESIITNPSSTENLWAYSYHANATYISSALDYVQAGDPYSDAIFQGYVTGAYGPWSPNSDSFSSGGVADYQSVHVFDTYITSAINQTVTFKSAGDDGHSFFIDDIFVAGHGFNYPVIPENTIIANLSMIANVQYKLTFIGDNYTGPWSWWLAAYVDDWRGPVSSAPNITMNATSAAPVPEPSTIFLLGSGLLGLGWYGRKRKKA